MKFCVQVRQEVKDFIERLPPESRRRLKLAMRALETESGERLALREQLAGFHRLRAGGFRLIYRYLPGRVIECVFTEKRSLVYHLFEREMLEHLRRESENHSLSDDSGVNKAPAKYGRPVKRRRKPSGNR